MMIRTITICTALAVATGAALAHHGWGSYNEAAPITVAGPIMTLKFDNPHATATVRGSDEDWTVTLAPPVRMTSRGATEKVVAVGHTISAYGYPSSSGASEMRAERITVEGKTYEMR
jgi:hypothetical protein